ncbi:MAG: hypothetical protein JSW46_02735 [Gemmatimonadota bacterium]|nr:MAG: hypothetical protein JSW46_02735 [Gemmatimonadota bacterium]
MTEFEYIAVLISIVVGLGITHLLGGVGRLIGRPGSAKAYWIHLLWVVYVFLYLIQFWWWEFSLSGVETWRFELYFFLIIYAVLLYLLCVILFPRQFPEGGDYHDHFYARRGWFFGLFIVVYIVDVFDTLFKGTDYFMSQPVEYLISTAAFVALFAVAILSRNARFHGAYVIGAIVYQWSWFVRSFGTMP